TPHLRSSAELASGLPLSQPGRKLLVAGQSPAQFLAELVHHGQYVDALRLIAVALLPREAVWWACLCCRHTLDVKGAPPAEARALLSAAAWVVHPDEAHRAAAASAGAAAGPKTAAGCAAQAASFGGHATGPNQPAVPTDARTLAKLAGAGVLLAAV